MEIQINLKNWSLRQYRNFSVAVQSGDFDTILDSLSKLVISWGYDGDPSNVDYWLDNLNVEQWMEVVRQVTDQLGKAFNAKN